MLPRVVKPTWYIGKEKLWSAAEVLQQRQAEEARLAYDSWFQWIVLLHCAIHALDRQFRLFVYSVICDNHCKDTVCVKILAGYDFL